MSIENDCHNIGIVRMWLPVHETIDLAYYDGSIQGHGDTAVI